MNQYIVRYRTHLRDFREPILTHKCGKVDLYAFLERIAGYKYTLLMVISPEGEDVTDKAEAFILTCGW